MTEAQQAALRSFYSFHAANSFTELAEAEALIRQAKTFYAGIWCAELQRHWVTALKMLGRRRNRAASAEARVGTEAAPKPAPLIDAQSVKVRTSPVGLNIPVQMSVVERRFVGSDHVVLDDVFLIIDGMELALPPEAYKHPTIARALKTISRAPYVDKLPQPASNQPKTVEFKLRAA